VQDASLNFARARGRADEARRMRDDAAGAAVREIQGAMPPDTVRDLLKSFCTGASLVKMLMDGSKELTRNRWTIGRYPQQWKKWIDRFGEQGDFLRYKKSPFLQWLKDHEKVVKQVGDSRVLRFLDLTGTTVDLVYEARDLHRDWRTHDPLAVTTGLMDVGGTALKGFGKTPVTYLSGVVLHQYSDVIGHARQVDWGDLPSMEDWKKYGWDSFKDALKVTGRDIKDWVL
jgi:hypothetical protein